jgi:hypothetical protein
LRANRSAANAHANTDAVHGEMFTDTETAADSSSAAYASAPYYAYPAATITTTYSAAAAQSLGLTQKLSGIRHKRCSVIPRS